jgi:hypothetical protein
MPALAGRIIIDENRVGEWESGRVGEWESGGFSHSPILPFPHSSITLIFTGEHFMMAGYLWITIVTLLLFVSPVDAAFFQTAGRGVRPASTGEAFVAFSDDANSLWYNPAGLTRMRYGEVTLMYGVPFTGLSSGSLNQTLLNVVPPWGASGRFGIGLSRLGTEGSAELVTALGSGLSLNPTFSIGATVKLLYWNVEGSTDPVSNIRDRNRSSTDVSLDVGLLYTPEVTGRAGPFSLGVVLRDVTSPNISESGDDGGKLPRTVEAGVLVHHNNIRVALDAKWRDEALTLHGGGEYRIQGTDFFLRGGGKAGVGDTSGTETGDIGFGIGYNSRPWSFDYAYTYPVVFQQGTGSHWFSLRYTL